MGEVHTLTPRARPRNPDQGGIPGGSPATLRSQIEEAAQHAIDTAEQLIAILDRLDGNTDDEDAEPSLGSLEGRENQIVWLRGTDRDLEITSPEDR